PGDTLVVRRLARLQDAEDPRLFAFHGVRYADRSRLGDDPARDRCGLELCQPDALARDVERVVAPAVQVPVAVRVDRRPVAVRPCAGEPLPVGLDESRAVVVADAARHPGPRAVDEEVAYM